MRSSFEFFTEPTTLLGDGFAVDPPSMSPISSIDAVLVSSSGCAEIVVDFSYDPKAGRDLFPPFDGDSNGI